MLNKKHIYLRKAKTTQTTDCATDTIEIRILKFITNARFGLGITDDFSYGACEVFISWNFVWHFDFYYLYK